MRRDTEYFSMYSTCRYETRFFSSSNRALRKRFGKPALPTPVGPRNRKYRSTIRSECLRANAGWRVVTDALDRFVLADHALMQDIVEAKEFFTFAFHELRNGDSRPASHDAYDLSRTRSQETRAALSQFARRSSSLQPGSVRISIPPPC